jgi:hypothetical protein
MTDKAKNILDIVAKILTGVITAVCIGLGSLVVDMQKQIAVLHTQHAIMKAQLGVVIQQRTEIVQAMNNNTVQIQNMRLQVERMLVVKPADVYRKVEELEKLIRQSRMGK